MGIYFDKDEVEEKLFVLLLEELAKRGEQMNDPCAEGKTLL